MGPFSSNVDSPMTVYKNSWYEDVSWFVTNMTPWFYRGYDYVSGKYSGIFAFGSAYGHPLSDYGFRIVLSIS